jgi:alpha-amylase/alpha-mannosidase (GH57 family)
LSDAISSDQSRRQICIHGHFYQPPRDNPWLERIERQPTAAPYHDWNERIAHECYAANAAARILGDDDYIVDIVNNYERISFNIGPTLMEWLRSNRARVYEAIQRADRRSLELQNGHGNAIAQAFNHLIMPLANLRDRRTQIDWGIRDFERHFDRRPEGMWLPETAVGTDTLEALAEHGIEFTILAPRQAESVRPLGSDDSWTRVGDGLDTTMPYRQHLPSGKSIDIFFYNGDISRAVAFEKLLERGEFLASRLMHAFGDRDRPQLVHIATDGETYGHHHRHGEMALAYALRQLQRDKSVSVTNYGRFLAENPPTMEVRVVDDSSWSCVHGVERWKSDCGCQTGGPSTWSQSWRAPLRHALDELRDDLTRLFESRGKSVFDDPWRARSEYVELIHIDEAEDLRAAVVSLMSAPDPSDEDVTTALRLLEMSRQSMLMFTSCGWFFNDVAGIETVQILQYAGRAIELADELSGEPERRERFLETLSRARSNMPNVESAREVFVDQVEPRACGLRDAARHFALSELFSDAVQTEIDVPFESQVTSHHFRQTARGRLGGGQINVESSRTLADESYGYVVAHLGDHNVLGGLTKERIEDVGELFHRADEAFGSAEMVPLVRWFDSTFDATFDLRALFSDVQTNVVNWLLDSVVAEATDVHEQLYTRHAPLLRFLARTTTEPPRVFKYAAESVLNERLETLFEQERLEPALVDALLDEFAESDITIDETRLLDAAQARLLLQVSVLRENPASTDHAVDFRKICSMATRAPVEVSLWDARNLCFELLEPTTLAGLNVDQRWTQAMSAAADALRIRRPNSQ